MGVELELRDMVTLILEILILLISLLWVLF